MPVKPKAQATGFDLTQHFADQMGAMLGPNFPTDIGLAVSGGGDSMVMMQLAADWARVFGIRLWVATVDHGLRPESAAEAEMVKAEATEMGLPHTTLNWTGWNGRGNLQDAARQVRIDLLSSWRGNCRHVLMGHTQDDQAETVIMRLARGSGVEGLAAIRQRREIRSSATQIQLGKGEMSPEGPPWPEDAGDTWEVLRPLLNVGRAQLRHYAKTLRVPFVDDPSNDDPAYARVRARKLIAEMDVDQATLAATATRMSRATEALQRRAFDVASQLLLDDPRLPGCVILDRDGFAKIEIDTQLRLLAGALQYVASAAYRPRSEPLEAALDTVLSGGVATLGGVVLTAQGARIFVAREPNALSGISAQIDPDALWDQRWLISGDVVTGMQVRALGEAGLLAVPYEIRKGAPRLALASLPAIWDGDVLFACIPCGIGPDYVMNLAPKAGNFPSSLLTH